MKKLCLFVHLLGLGTAWGCHCSVFFTFYGLCHSFSCIPLTFPLHHFHHPYASRHLHANILLINRFICHFLLFHFFWFVSTLWLALYYTFHLHAVLLLVSRSF